MALSFVQYAGNGSTATFAIPFTYLDQTHIRVLVGNASVAFTWATTNTIRITPTPAAGSVIEIRRVTPRDNPMVDFVDGSVLTETDLDLAVAQVFNIVQEALDIAGGTLELLPSGGYSAGGRKIEQLGDPSSPRDAVNLRYFEGNFLPQMQAFLQQTQQAAQAGALSREGAVTALAQANAARDLAIQYRNTADAHRAAAAVSEGNAAASAQASQTARTGSEAARDASSAHRLNASNAEARTIAARDVTTAARDETLGYRDTGKVHADNAEASAQRAAQFDPSSFYTKTQIDQRLPAAIPSPLNARYLRATSNGYELRTAAQVLSDIGAAAASSFELNTAAANFYYRLPSGLIIQGGSTVVNLTGTPGQAYVSFRTAFSGLPFTITALCGDPQNPPSAGQGIVTVTNWNRFGFDVRLASHQTIYNGAFRCNWIAMGGA